MPYVEWTPEQIAAFERKMQTRPHVGPVHHISLAVKDLETSKKFYAEVLGGRIVNEGTPNFSEVVVGGAIIGLGVLPSNGEWQRPQGEYPHLAFEVASDEFLPLKKWLEDHGVKTHAPWTRHQIEGLMYLKDPSGNLIEIFCPRFAGAKELQQSRTLADVARLSDLDYEWDESYLTTVDA